MFDRDKKIEELLSSLRDSSTPTSEAYQRFVLTIFRVPSGSVASYGQIAKLAGYPGHARQVVRTLHSSSKKYKLPWHRVINSQGKISLANESFFRQKILLRKEGIEFDDSGKIDLVRFGWSPKIAELKKLFKLLKNSK